MSKGNKHDQEKIRTDLLPVRPLMAIAKVLTHGANRYGDRNWEKGFEWSRAYGATLRHLLAFWDGEDIDGGESGTGESHLACAATEILFLLEFSHTKQELDDRPCEEIAERCYFCRDCDNWLLRTYPSGLCCRDCGIKHSHDSCMQHSARPASSLAANKRAT